MSAKMAANGIRTHARTNQRRGPLDRGRGNLKGPVQCFSMQVVMNNLFRLNSEEKIGANPYCRFREKRKNHQLQRTPIPEKMTSPSRRQGYSNNQFNC